MNTKISLGCGKMVEFNVAECCYEDSPTNVLERPDLAPTDHPDWRVCSKCGRKWKKCIKYIGSELQVSHDWVPMPFAEEEYECGNPSTRSVTS